MPIKINELVIQVKVYETNPKVENAKSMPADFLLNATEHEKLALVRDFLSLLEDREAR